MKRGYLLPPGCKDLHDALKLELKQVPEGFWESQCMPTSLFDVTVELSETVGPLPPIKGQIVIPPHTTVKKLAALLDQKPFQIIGDLMQLGIFATVDFLVDFKSISKVARMYGFTAIRAA